MSSNLNTWTAAEMAAQFAADIANGNIRHVADMLRTMDTLDAAAVALLVGGHVSPAKRALLADMILGG